MDDPALARKIAAEKRGFVIHATVYWIVVPALWVLYAMTMAGQNIFPWPIFTTLGWGSGLMAHYFGMQKKVRQLEAQRGAALAAPTPPLALPDGPEEDATLARAEALLARERTG